MACLIPLAKVPHFLSMNMHLLHDRGVGSTAVVSPEVVALVLEIGLAQCTTSRIR